MRVSGIFIINIYRYEVITTSGELFLLNLIHLYPKGNAMYEDASKMNHNERSDMGLRVYAKTAMKNTGHRVIATPHILMGVLRGGTAASLLNRTFGVKLIDVARIIEHLPKPLPQGLGDDFAYTDGAKAVLDKAQELSAKYGFEHPQVYTDYLLVALLMVNDEAFVHVMGEIGVDHDDLMAEAMKSLERKTEKVKA